jgi:hypothetical protein
LGVLGRATRRDRIRTREEVRIVRLMSRLTNSTVLPDMPGLRSETIAPTVTVVPIRQTRRARSAGELGRLGPYRVLGVLDQGGMGMVFRADDSRLRRQFTVPHRVPRLSDRTEEVK